MVTKDCFHLSRKLSNKKVAPITQIKPRIRPKTRCNGQRRQNIPSTTSLLKTLYECTNATVEPRNVPVTFINWYCLKLTSRDHARKTDWFYARIRKHHPQTCNRRTGRTAFYYRRSYHHEEPPRRWDNPRRRRCRRNRDRHDDEKRNEEWCTAARLFCLAGSEGPLHPACNHEAEAA